MNNRIYNVLNELDPNTYIHSFRLYQLAEEYEEQHYEGDSFKMAALLHDIGKFYIPDKILNKPGKLNEFEREVIDMHSYYGLRILRKYNVDEDIVGMVYLHHFDEPPFIHDPQYSPSAEVLEKSRVLHTLDAFEALTADRPYREGLKIEEALEIISEDSRRSKEAYKFLVERYSQIKERSLVNTFEGIRRPEDLKKKSLTVINGRKNRVG